MPEFEMRPEKKEPATEVDLELCLRKLTLQAVGRQVDASIDGYLIHQINASHKGNSSAGANMECLVRGCEAKCILRKDFRGKLKLVSQSGVGICEGK